MKHRDKFNAAIESIIKNKKRDDNIFYFTTEEYNEKIKKVKELKTRTHKKTVTNYRLMRKYDVITIDGEEKLIKPIENDSDILYYVTVDELFEVIHTAHLAVGHGGRNKMMTELKTKYCNVTKEAVMAYLGLCGNCQTIKQSNPKKRLETRPNLDFTYNSRAQIDLIDMQSQCYNNYRYIMNYQDRLTKFIILKPLKTKRSEEIALNLIDIFTTFGAPAILHMNNGLEFVNSIITNINKMWSDVKIVYGKPCRIQESLEAVNKDIREILSSWMTENKSIDWPMALKFVQFQKNRVLNLGKY